VVFQNLWDGIPPHDFAVGDTSLMYLKEEKVITFQQGRGKRDSWGLNA